MALAAQLAAGRRNGEMDLLAVIEVMATPAAHTSVEESYTGIHGKRHLELAMVARCRSCVGHADRMVGHVSPPPRSISGALVFSDYHSGYIIVATQAAIGFTVHASDTFVAVFGRTLAFASLQVGFGRKLPVRAFLGSSSKITMTRYA